MLAFTLDCLFSVQLINQCFGGYSAETPTQQGQRLGYKREFSSHLSVEISAQLLQAG